MASLDMALDEVIKKNRRNNEKGSLGQARPRRGRVPKGSSRGGRPFGRFQAPRNPLGEIAGSSSFTIAKELFSEVGELVRYTIHFDKEARPSGTAEVIFVRTSDAFQAFKRYNNVQLDGRHMKIEIIGANMEIPISRLVNVDGANGKKRTVVMVPGPGRSRGGFTAANHNSMQNSRGGPSNVSAGSGSRGCGGGSRRGRGGARWRKRNVEKSADEHDEELLRYHAQAKQF